MDDSLVKELQEIGLSEKEARIYLASLELGPATAQQIAAKATILRPTTYVMIESLVGRGLIGEYMEGKKKMFSANDLSVLKISLLREREVIDKKQSLIEGLSTKLAAKSKKTDANDVHINVFEGQQGIIHHQNIVAEDAKSSGGDLFELVNLDLSERFIPSHQYSGDFRDKIRKKYNCKCLYSSSKDISKRNLTNQWRILDEDDQVEAALDIHGDMSVFTVYSDKPKLIMIENKAITRTLKTMFNALWDKRQ